MIADGGGIGFRSGHGFAELTGYRSGRVGLYLLKEVFIDPKVKEAGP